MAFGLPVDGLEADVPTAGEVARRDAPTCRLGDRAREVLARVPAAGWTRAPVLTSEGIVMGRLRRREADRHRSELVDDLMEAGPSTYRPSISCEEIAGAMRKGGFDAAFITDSEGRWIGLLARRDAESALRAWRAARRR